MVRKTIVLVMGSLLILAGVAMIILPGPAIIFIPLGIAVLSLEFEWAQRLLDRMKRWLRARTKKQS